MDGSEDDLLYESEDEAEVNMSEPERSPYDDFICDKSRDVFKKPFETVIIVISLMGVRYARRADAIFDINDVKQNVYQYNHLHFIYIYRKMTSYVINHCIWGNKNDSEVYLYSDDTKIFRKIVNSGDCDKLQEDINQLRKWSEKWLLNFHPEKVNIWG